MDESLCYTPCSRLVKKTHSNKCNVKFTILLRTKFYMNGTAASSSLVKAFSKFCFEILHNY